MQGISHRDPLSDFLPKLVEAQTLAERISAHIDDNLGANPEEVSWGNVGDAGRLVAAL